VLSAVDGFAEQHVLAPDIDRVVFDILGTLVNEPSGLHNSIRELAPTGSDDLVDLCRATSPTSNGRCSTVAGPTPTATSSTAKQLNSWRSSAA